MFLFFFFNDSATTEIYTLSLHDALPICRILEIVLRRSGSRVAVVSENELLLEEIRRGASVRGYRCFQRSEEHTSELQSQFHLVCRLLLEKKKKITYYNMLETHENEIDRA